MEAKKKLSKMENNRLSLIGGTFDALHRGHQEYIKLALSISDHVYLKLASDIYCRNHQKPYQVKPFESRKERIKLFLKSINCLPKVTILELDSLKKLEKFCLNSDEISTVIVSDEYFKQFKKYNEKRKKQNKKAFTIKIKKRFCIKNGVEISSHLANQKLLETLINYFILLLYFNKIKESRLSITKYMPRHIQTLFTPEHKFYLI